MTRALGALAVVLLALLSWQPAQAAPPASRIIKEARGFMSAARHIRATVRLQRGQDTRTDALVGAHSGLRALMRLERGLDGDAEVELTPEPPPGQPATLTIERDKSLRLDIEGEPGATLAIADIGMAGDPELRALALALAVTRLDKASRKMGVPLPLEVLTLDRIDKRLVWAIGGEKIAIWVDRDLYRPVRLLLAAGVLDAAGWSVKMTYEDSASAPGRGWFPSRVQVSRDDRIVLILHVIEADLR